MNIFTYQSSRARYSLPVPESFVECVFFSCVCVCVGRLSVLPSVFGFARECCTCVGMPEHVSAFRYGFAMRCDASSMVSNFEWIFCSCAAVVDSFLCAFDPRFYATGAGRNECVFIWCSNCVFARTTIFIGSVECWIDNEQK